MAKAKKSSGGKNNLFKAWVKSFYSRELYQDVAENWTGTGYGYFFLSVLLLTLPIAGSLQWMMAQKTPGFFQQVPPFQIVNGVFSSPVTQPYRIDFKDGAIVIDTTGRYTDLTSLPGYADLKMLVLINKTQWMQHRVRFGRVEDKTHQIPRFAYQDFNRDRLDRLGAKIVEWSGVAYYFFLVLIWTLTNFISLLVYALFAVVFADLRKGSLDYSVALRLAVASHFPAMLFYTAVLCLSIKPPWFFLWTFLISTGYLYFAVGAQKKLQPA